MKNHVDGRRQLLMMAAFDSHVEAALDLTARWALSLHAGGGVGELRRFILYLMATKGREAIEAFEGALRRHGLGQGDEIVTYAQELLAEGRAEGQVEVVEGLLRVGVTWDVIEAATGLNEAGFRALKEHLTDSGS